MARHCKLSQLLSAVLSLVGFNSSFCQAQNSDHHTFSSEMRPPAGTTQSDSKYSRDRVADANFFSVAPWMQSNPGSAVQRLVSGNGSQHSWNYDPMHIDAARRTAVQYRSTLPSNPSFVSEFANTNASLVEQWSELADKINALSIRVVAANAMLDAATRDYEDVGLKLGQHGLTPTIGLLLSHKKSQLEDWQVDGSAGHSVQDEIQRSRSRQLENGMVQYDGKNVVRQTSEILAAEGLEPSQVDYAQRALQIQTLLRERNEWLQLLTRGYDDYRQKLGELDSASTALDRLISDYRQRIRRLVTWIRSGDPIEIADISKARTGLSSFFDPNRIADFGFSLRQKWTNSPASGFALLITILVILALRILAMIWLTGIGRRKRMKEATASARKCAASLLTPLVSMAIPSILYLTARWLGSGFVTHSTLHVSQGLYAASLVALIVEVPRQLLRTNGFLEKHLRIELPRQKRASAYLQVVGTGLVLFAYVVTLAELVDHGIWGGSVARIGFIASLLLVAWTAHLALKPRGGFIEPLIEKFGGQVVYRIRLVFYCLGVGFPLSMIALSCLGYEFTATDIIKRVGLMFVSLLIGATLWSAVKILCSGAWHTLTGTRDPRQVDENRQNQPARVTGVMAQPSLELKHQMAFLAQCGLLLAAIVCSGWLWTDILPSLEIANPVVWTFKRM